MASVNGTTASEEAVPVVEAQAEVETKKEPVLTPAPIPTKSPWKSVSADIPVSNIPVDSLEASKKKKNKAGTPAISSSTKWVPMKASFVVSGPKRAGSGPRKASNKGAANGGGKKKKQQQPPSSKKHPAKPKSSKDENTKEKDDEQSDAAEEKSSQDQVSVDQQSTHSAYQKRRHNHSNQFQHSAHQQGGFPRRRYYNNFNNNNDSLRQQRYAHHTKEGFNQYYGRIPRSFGHQHHLINNHAQSNVAPMYQQFYSMQPILMAVNSIARQIEYYFSSENLEKDSYLKSKLSKDGYAPVALIAKFYRVVNMSFGGDSSLILAALREIVRNDNATVEVATGKLENSEADGAESEASILTNYFVRSKDWEKLLPETFSTVVEIENKLEGDALDEFMIKPTPITTDENHEASSNSNESDDGIPEGSEDDKSSTNTLKETKVESL